MGQNKYIKESRRFLKSAKKHVEPPYLTPGVPAVTLSLEIKLVEKEPQEKVCNVKVLKIPIAVSFGKG